MWTQRISIIAVLLAVSGCETVNPEYCDERVRCTEPNTVCDEKQNKCVPAPDSGPLDMGVDQGEPDLGPDISVDGPPSPDQKVAKEIGDSCKDGAECGSGFCVDGYCCGSKCDSTCVACNIKDKEGTCTPYDDKTDPESECGGSHTDCGGSCDGSGSCSYAAATKACGAPVCTTGELETGLCDGGGVCVRSKKSCGGYDCADTTSCRKDCSDPSHCTGVFQCLNNVCIANLALGAPCGTNNKACDSGFCVDGVCCKTGPCGDCKRCDLAGAKKGTCNPVTDGTSCGADSCVGGSFLEPECQSGQCKNKATSCAPFLCNVGGTACIVICAKDGDCTTGHYCDAGGQCVPKKGNGDACSDKKECTSGICTAEGFCCDRACTGECETCNGKTACTFKTAGTKCGPADACKDDPTSSYIETHACDGSSATCKTSKTTCDPYGCGAGLTCKTSCMANSDCSSKVCEFWNKGNGPHDCVTATNVCYADAAAAAGGTGSLAAPFTSPSSCPSSMKIIALADGTYPSTVFTATSELTVTGTGAGATLYNNGVLQVGANVTLKAAANTGATLRLVGLSLGGGVEASDASSLRMIRTRTLNGLGVVRTGNVLLQDVSIEGGQPGIEHSVGTLTLENVRVNGVASAGIRSKAGTVQGSDLSISNTGGSCAYIWNGAISLDKVSAKTCGGYGIEVVGTSAGAMSNVLVADASNTAFHVETASPFSLSHATLISGADPMSCTDPATKVVNSILSKGGGEGAATLCTVSYSFTSESGTGNISGDARFVSLSTGDYRLQSTSACVDAGQDVVPGGPNPTTDLDGNPRRVKKKTNTNSADMGAYELQ